jgi:EmrB/QacA subfamily drug resistance transporter
VESSTRHRAASVAQSTSSEGQRPSKGLSVERPFGGRADRRWVVLAIAAVATAFVWVDATALNIAFPALERTYPQASRSTLSWVLNGYNIVFAAFLVPAGRLADILGRKRLFLVGVAVFGAASALCAAAPSLEVLVICRLLQGIGAAVMLPAGFALVLTAFPPAELPSAVALWVSAGSAAGALGPVVGGAVIQAGSWRWIFVLNVPVAAAVVLIGKRALREVLGLRQQLPDLVGTVAVALFVACVSMVILQGPEWGWDSPRIFAGLIALPFLLAVAVARSARHAAPALDLPLLRQRQVAIANLGSLVFGMSVFGGILTNVLFLSTAWHYSALQAALAVTPPPIAAALAAGPAGKQIVKHGPRLVGVIGIALFAAGMGWILISAGGAPDYIGDWLPGTLLFGAGIGVASPAFASTAIRSAPIQAFGLASSINTAARQVGGVLGVSILISVMGSLGNGTAISAFRNAWIVDVAVTLLAGVLALSLKRPAVSSSPTSMSTASPKLSPEVASE